MKIVLVMWRRGMRGVGLEAGASLASHWQERSGEGLSLANDSESERSGLGMLKIQTLGTVWASQVALMVKNPTASPGDKIFGFDPWIGKIPWKTAWKPTSVNLAWRIPWTEEAGGLQSKGLQKVGHD